MPTRCTGTAAATAAPSAARISREVLRRVEYDAISAGATPAAAASHLARTTTSPSIRKPRCTGKASLRIRVRRSAYIAASARSTIVASWPIARVTTAATAAGAAR